MDIGYAPGVDRIRALNPKVLILLGADDGAIEKTDLGGDTFVIYLGKVNST